MAATLDLAGRGLKLGVPGSSASRCQGILVFEQYFMDTGRVIEGWLSVAEAAERLGISVQRVRQLLHAGELDSRKGPGGWVVAENAVRAREQAPPAAGRPLSSHMAWLVVAQLLAADSRPESGVDLEPDRRDRYRLRHLLAHRGLERDWACLLYTSP